MLSMKNHVREALVTAALFGSVGAALASASANSRGVPSTPSLKVLGHSSVVDAPAAQRAAASVIAPAVLDLTQGAG
jgi:hypothetical protein